MTTPTYDECLKENRCGVLGPTVDGQPLRCTRGLDHHGRHRNNRDYRDVKWTHPYQPRIHNGYVVSTTRPGTHHPGPQPQAGTPRDPTPPNPAPAETSPQPDEIPLCTHTTNLHEPQCRRWWQAPPSEKHDTSQPHVRHVCTLTNHETTAAGNTRHECTCGRQTRTEPADPLPPDRDKDGNLTDY